MFIVEGNIGTGKTTMLQAIQKKLPHLSVQLESVSDWQQKQEGRSILEQFYTDPSRWAYTMEITSLTTRIPEHFFLQQKKEQAHLIERSIYSGFHCFAYNGYLSKFLEPIEWEICKQWFDFALRKCTPPQGFIYLQADPETSYERILQRARAEEATMPFEYIQQIHNRHEEFLIHKKNVHPSIEKTPVLVLDCNKDIALEPTALETYVKKIERFVADIKPEVTQQYKYDACQP